MKQSKWKINLDISYQAIMTVSTITFIYFIPPFMKVDNSIILWTEIRFFQFFIIHLITVATITRKPPNITFKDKTSLSISSGLWVIGICQKLCRSYFLLLFLPSFLACLLACLFACLLACLFACLLVCLLAYLHI